jgi:hypothetical protein
MLSCSQDKGIIVKKLEKIEVKKFPFFLQKNAIYSFASKAQTLRENNEVFKTYLFFGLLKSAF